MRIIHVAPGITESGIGVHVRELTEALSRRGIETRIYTVGSIETGKLFIPSDPKGRITLGNLEILEFFGINPPTFGGILPEISNPFPHPIFVKRLSEEEGIIHIHGNEYFITIVAALLSNIGRKPYVLSVHNVGKAFTDYSSIRFLRKVLNLSLFKYAIKHADAVIAPTDEAANYVRKFQPRRVEKIRLAIDFRRFSGLRERNGGYVLYLGRLDPVKEVDLLIDAAPLVLERTDINFVIAGDGIERARLESLAVERGVEDKIRFLGKVRYANVPKVLSGAAVFYAGRGSGYTLLESAAARRPIVCIEDEWSIYTIGGKSNALFVPKDRRRLAEAILSILESPELAHSLIEGAYSFVLKNASWDCVIEDYIRLYKSLE
ncbi:MAG: glycosyltransferase family 4 protein [Candidatus Bathyarchaeota archaeon]|nr:glycosyltransferase family 4 protein [Candidatus Bathyarchaeota archaeon]